MKVIDFIAWILVIIGGLNWGFVGLFSFDVISILFGLESLTTSIIYVIIGVAAIYLLVAMPYERLRPRKEKL